MLLAEGEVLCELAVSPEAWWRQVTCCSHGPCKCSTSSHASFSSLETSWLITTFFFFFKRNLHFLFASRWQWCRSLEHTITVKKKGLCYKCLQAAVYSVSSSCKGIMNLFLLALHKLIHLISTFWSIDTFLKACFWQLLFLVCEMIPSWVLMKKNADTINRSTLYTAFP